jgi:hypothetical protein
MAGRSNDSNPDAMFGTNFKFTTANSEQRISAHATSRLFFNDDVITFQNAASGAADSAISWSERMRIDSSGNVGIGTSSPAATFVALDGESEGGEIAIFSGTNQDRGLSISTFKNGIYGNAGVDFNAQSVNASVMSFSTNSTERMRITSGGDVLIGTTSTLNANVDGLHVDALGSLHAMCVQSGGNGYGIVLNNSAGTVVGSIGMNASTTSYNTSSDYRLKENVVPMEGALDRVDQLKPSRFNFIADEDTTVDGFLAHEVQDIVPEAVTGDKDAMRTEEYEVTLAVYKDIIHPAEEAVYETIDHPAIEEELDEEGNVIVEGKDAYTEEILVTEAKEEWTENVLVSEAVMGTREVPDYQGIDQSKLVPLLVGAIKELRAEINSLKAQINN